MTARQRDLMSVKFWGICFGTHDAKTGERIVPKLADRKRLANKFNFNPPLSWWREVWIKGKD